MDAQGLYIEEGIDYDEVFAPVARIEVIRLFLAYALFKDFVVYQMDVKSVFLYGKIEEEVYVYQPPGFKDSDSLDRVYKVEKALYGLHQAPRAWYETLSTYLLDNEFQRGKIDKTLFIKRYKGDILLVQVYMDDIIFGSTKKELCNAFEKLMHVKFQMSSMGELTFFLGLQVEQKKDGIFTSQDKYVGEILKKFGFTKVKTASTPIETQKPLLKDENGEEVDVHMYRSMIGSLMYLTSSRLYLSGQPKLGLWYPKDSPFDLVAYTDSDYARASLDRKSTTGGCQFLGCRLISWQCKKQTVVANSTTEAEYVAASSCCGQSVWTGIGVNAGNLKLMLLGINLLLLVKVNATRHKLTTAGERLPLLSSLEAEQDSGNIAKTQSKATPNESSSLGTTSGGGPRCQETMGDTIAQTRVLYLEKTKTTQAEEIVSLKRRVKKLEHKKRSRTHRLKRLYKVGLTARVESSRDEESLGEDASKKGRINAIDADEDITLAQALAALKSVKPKVKSNVIEEPSVPVSVVSASTKVSVATTTTAIILTPRKGIVITELESKKPLKKKVQIMLDEEEDKRLQAEFDEEERLARKKDEVSVVLIEEWDDIQAKIEADHELAQRLQPEEQEQFTTEQKATLFKELLEQRIKHFAA
ncbi:putative ribonuclease H-like domain-containing protein, partial [Tanacetum coccineum]